MQGRRERAEGRALGIAKMPLTVRGEGVSPLRDEGVAQHLASRTQPARTRSGGAANRGGREPLRAPHLLHWPVQIQHVLRKLFVRNLARMVSVNLVEQAIDQRERLHREQLLEADAVDAVVGAPDAVEGAVEVLLPGCLVQQIRVESEGNKLVEIENAVAVNIHVVEHGLGARLLNARRVVKRGPHLGKFLPIKGSVVIEIELVK
mmetsp:Transcript_37624/g.100841  ORF Transcript_37624/g.100841 Transcript_37624/m.100841 type:complete len:205 (-) Transcript_37624:403-1017(-)